MKRLYSCLVIPALLLFTSGNLVAQKYITPSGGAVTPLDGSSWTRAYPGSRMQTTLNELPNGGTLYVGAGTYQGITFNLRPIPGIATAWKRIVGVPSGNTLPHFVGGPWDRDPANYNVANRKYQVMVPGSYWRVDNIELSHALYGLYNLSEPVNDFVLRNVEIHDVEIGMELNRVSHAVIENVTVKHYTKNGLRVDIACDDITFRNCEANLTDGDNSWWNYTPSMPFGFFVNNENYDANKTNTNIRFLDCIAANNRKNNQNDPYWNGDGFVVERYNSGITFNGCIATNNEDGGFDIKSAATLTNCISVKNYRGFRLWHTAKTLTNCMASFPYRRNNSNQVTGVAAGDGLWTDSSGITTLDHFTFYGSGGIAADAEPTGKLTLTNSILAFSGTAGVYTSGTVDLSNTAAPTTDDSITHRAGEPLSPGFYVPSQNWNGIGYDMDNSRYKLTKGYTSTVFRTREAEGLGYWDSGEGSAEVAEAPASGGKWIKFNGNSVGDWVEFTVPHIAATTYTVKIRSRNLNSRGRYQLSIDGVNIGAPVDQYHASGTYPEVTVGTVTFTEDGRSTFRFTVTGKNAASSGYTLSVDTIILTPGSN